MIWILRRGDKYLHDDKTPDGLFGDRLNAWRFKRLDVAEDYRDMHPGSKIVPVTIRYSRLHAWVAEPNNPCTNSTAAPTCSPLSNWASSPENFVRLSDYVDLEVPLQDGVEDLFDDYEEARKKIAAWEPTIRAVCKCDRNWTTENAKAVWAEAKKIPRQYRTAERCGVCPACLDPETAPRCLAKVYKPKGEK